MGTPHGAWVTGRDPTPPGGKGYVTAQYTFGSLLTLSHALKRGGPPPGGRGYVAPQPSCSALLFLFNAMKCRRRPRRPRLCSYPAIYGSLLILSPALTLRGPRRSIGCVAAQPTCAPLISSPVVEQRGPRKQRGSYSPPAHLWARAKFVPCCGASGTPSSRRYLATRPTYGALLLLSHALKRYKPTMRQGLCRQSAHLWADFDFPPRLGKAFGTPKAIGAMQLAATRRGHS